MKKIKFCKGAKNSQMNKGQEKISLRGKLLTCCSKEPQHSQY